MGKTKFHCLSEDMGWQPKSVFVTGGCGFIGSNFINQMVDRWPQANFLNLDKLSLGSETVDNVDLTVQQRSNRYRFVHGDYSDGSLVGQLLQTYHVDLIVNFAAESNVDVSFARPTETFDNNVVGLIGLLESCRLYGHLSKFLHISTDEVYGESQLGAKVTGKIESDPFGPTNPYAMSKVVAEQLINAYRQTAKLPAVVVRMNNVLGPRQHCSKVTPKFIQQIRSGQPVTIQGSGTQVRSWMFITDAIEGIQLSAQRAPIGEIFNLGTNDECSISGLAEEIHKRLLTTSDPIPLRFQNIPDRPHNDRRYLLCSKKAEVNQAYVEIVGVQSTYLN